MFAILSSSSHKMYGKIKKKMNATDIVYSWIMAELIFGINTTSKIRNSIESILCSSDQKQKSFKMKFIVSIEWYLKWRKIEFRYRNFQQIRSFISKTKVYCR